MKKKAWEQFLEEAFVLDRLGNYLTNRKYYRSKLNPTVMVGCSDGDKAITVLIGSKTIDFASPKEAHHYLVKNKYAPTAVELYRGRAA